MFARSLSGQKRSSSPRIARSKKEDKSLSAGGLVREKHDETRETLPAARRIIGER